MDEQRDARLDQIATEAGIARASFLEDAEAQFLKFLEDNAERVKELGGLVLIDDGPEYLEVTADGTLKSRTRVQDDSDEWVTEGEVDESIAKLIETYHPADLYSAFADSARDEAGLSEQPGADEEPSETEDVASEAELAEDDEGDDDDTDDVGTPENKDDAARMLYDLALTYQERSQNSQAQLLDRFEDASEGLASMVGGTMIVDDEGERIWYRSNGIFEAEVLPAPDDDDEEDSTDTDESEPEWQALTTPQEMVQFYDPTDLFGDLAETIAEDHPSVAPEPDDDSDSS